MSAADIIIAFSVRAKLKLLHLSKDEAMPEKRLTMGWTTEVPIPVDVYFSPINSRV